MFRAAHRLQQNGTAKVVIGALGASSCATSGIYFYKRPLLLDSDQDTRSWWRRKSEVVPAAAPVAATLDNVQDARSNSNAADAKTNNKNSKASQPPPPQTKGHSVFDIEGDAEATSAWQQATDSLGAISEKFTGFDLSSIREQITRLVLPGWVRILPGLVTKLQHELSMEPWSLSWEIWEDAHNPEINPEIIWDAEVRISQDLCKDEQIFLQNRRVHTAKALARYLGVQPDEVHPDDVPIIAMCGSGGGLRALVAGSSSYLSAHEAGLYDCVTYTAGVSGSCWLQALYYSSIADLSHQKLIDHLKNRIGVHIAYPPAALSLLNSAPTNKYLLSGFIEKLKGVPDADFGLVDVYGLLLAARLMVPRGELRVSDWDLKVSNQRYYVDDGLQPLPIYTAVRHEIPGRVEDIEKVAKDARFNLKHYDWFQWFEWTPYEFFCEELNAGIPTWAMGRRFEGGQNVWRENGFALPELRVPLLLGIWGSAFCATLSHYYREVRPIIKAAGLGGLDGLLSKRDEDLIKVHPVDPAVIPNFLLGLRDKLPTDCPESIHKANHLQLMDAGMSNNLPIYPLLRPGRDVDVIVAFDASADVKTDNWIRVVDGYVRQRGIKGWPMGAGWPPLNAESSDSSSSVHEEMAQAEELTHSSSPQDIAQMQSSVGADDPSNLGPCTVWVGTRAEHAEFMDEPHPQRITSDSSTTDTPNSPLTAEDAGIALIYFPFLPNSAVPGVDPQTSEFMSTWNFVYTAGEIDDVVRLARANFEAGAAQTKTTIRAVWERKRRKRLKREEREAEDERRRRVRKGLAAMRRNGDVGQGDQFGGL